MTYAAQTEYASSNLIDLITHEERELESLKNALRDAEAKYQCHASDFQTSDLNDDFSETYVQAAFVRMAKAHQEVEKLKVRIDQLQVSIGAKQVAIQAMCGALLQIAKQGISLVHGSLAAAPNGRNLSGVDLKDIVWHGRNQALHYEEGNFRAPVTNLFGQLEKAFGAGFSLAAHPKQSRAKQIFILLGWGNYTTYSADMKSLGL